MKCYEIKPYWTELGCFDLSLRGNSRGVPINTTDAEQSYISVLGPECNFVSSEKRALLSESLMERLTRAQCDRLFTHNLTNLNSCSVDARSNIWLDLPDIGTENDALILTSFFGRRVQKKKAPVAFSTAGEGSSILIANEVSHRNSHGDHDGLAVLAHLKPGGSLILKARVLSFRSSKNRSHLGDLKDEWVHPTQDINVRITAMQDGSLSQTPVP